MEVVMNIDTSDTHKYGEILLNDDNGNYVTVGPINGDEDKPNYGLAYKINAIDGLLDALESVVSIISQDHRSYVQDIVKECMDAIAKATEITS